MKVWYVLMTFPSSSQTFVANDVQALRRLGLNVSVHALRGARSDAVRLLHERRLADLEVTHGGAGNILHGFLAATARPLRAARLARWVVRQSGGRPVHLMKGLALVPRILGLFGRLERERPDVIHLYWGHYPSIFGWLVLEEAPVVVSMSLSAYDLLCDFPGSATVARRAHLVSTWAAANVPAIADRGVPAESVHVCRQGLDLEKVKGRDFLKVRHRIVTAGRLVAEKGMDDVLRAFARIAPRHTDARLIVLGEGPDRPRLEELACALGIEGAVTFRGHVAHDQVFEELARAEVFLFLSRYAGERLPNVVKEAMACRCLVVTTATPGIEELLEHGTHGWVVSQGAWEEAAACVERVLGQAEASEAMAGAAQVRVLEEFDVLRLMGGMVRRWEQARMQVQRTAPRSPDERPVSRDRRVEATRAAATSARDRH